MEKIKGIDTIKLDNNIPLPATVDISFNVMKAMQESIDIANRRWIAMIPYCIVCKTPLTWVRDSDLVFECPQCKMKWKKANGWDKTKEKALNVKK